MALSFCLGLGGSRLDRPVASKGASDLDRDNLKRILTLRLSTCRLHLRSRDNRAGKPSRSLVLSLGIARECQSNANRRDVQGFWVGPEISNRLKQYFGVENVATEGVDYLGLIDTNFMKGGAAPFAIGLMQTLLAKAVTQCPGSKIIAAGYR